jgi:chitin synthase
MHGLSGVLLSENAWLKLVDPKLTFAEDAAAKYHSGAYGEPGYYDDVKSIAGQTINTLGGGDMFRFADNQSMIRVKDVGEAEDVQVDELTTSWARRRWMFIVWLLTFWIPDFFIKFLGRIKRKDVRVAWREKFAINLMIWLSCGACIVFLIFFPYWICPLQNVMTTQELSQYSYNNNPDKVYTAIRGIVFDLTQFAPTHYPPIVPTNDVLNYGGEDSSDLFPMQISAVCGGVNGTMSPYVVFDYTTNYSDPNTQYHDFRYFTNDSRPDWYLQQMEFFNQNYRKAYIGYTPEALSTLVSSSKYVAASLDGYVYDLSGYVNGQFSLKAPAGQSVPADASVDFMDPSVVALFQNFAGQDITSRYQQLDLDESVRANMNRCLRNVFMIGKLDTEGSVKCVFARYFLLAITIFVVLIIFIKFLAALQFSRSAKPEDFDKFFICQIPAYTEDEESLRRALDSMAKMNYDDKRKLLFVICDGMIVGAGNDRPTPRIVLDILGHPPDDDPQALSFESLGEGSKQHNMGKLYSGLYEVGGHIVPYVVLVKVGKPTENNRPGNRGKRDSQMILMRFLNRVHYNLPMSPLELELFHQIQNVIGVNPAYYEYLFQVDADTMVGPESANQLVGAMVHDTKIQAVCGETALSNSRESLITMMQVYEYYISHNLAKAFESLFGSVTCLPGCFSLYRVYDAVSGKPVFVSHAIVNGYAENRVDTLHTKNLLHLGEDRYLTTLLLKHNPRYKTKYLQHAKAWTVAPDSWSVFLSQRRRWINSTVHNLVELVPMSQMCGFCCFSMRFIVMVDLFSTIIQPVTVAYIAYLIYLCVTSTNNIPITSLVMLGAIYGLQALIFLLRRRWEMIGWMIIYLLAIPVFSLALPLYSFWYMDDFSWGNTRVVLGEKGKKIVVSNEGKFDPSEIPMQRWQDYQADSWRHDTADAQSVMTDKTRAMSVMTGVTRPMSEMTRPSSQMVRPMSVEAASLLTSRRQSTVDLPATSRASVANYDIEGPPPTLLPSDAELTNAIRQILKEADLMKVTKRSIRAQLEQDFGVKLNAKREYINYAVEAILTGEL